MTRWGALLLVLLLTFPAVAFAQFSFQQTSYPTVGPFLVRADFNNDGYPDLLGSGYGGRSFTILLNNGSGTFQQPRIVSDLGDSYPQVAADWNNDGNVDLIGCHGTLETRFDVVIWYGDGNASFSQPVALAESCAAVSSGDFNQDRKQDLALASHTLNPDRTPNNSVTVLFGDAAGHVSHAVRTSDITVMSLSGPCAFSSSVSGDFNRDGLWDLAVVSSCPNDVVDESALVFARGDGNGHFAFLPGNRHRSLLIRKDDVNQDGQLDLVASARYSGPRGVGGSSLSFLLGSTVESGITWLRKGILEYSHYAEEYTSSVAGGAAADLNGDGIKDALVLERFAVDEWNGPVEHNLVVMPGKADGGYGTAQKFVLPFWANSLAIGDFDRDGRVDVAVAAGFSTEIFLNRTPAPLCAANPSLRTVRICAPARISSNSLHLLANTTHNDSVNGMWVYVDNKGVFFTPNDLINRVLTVPTGGHRLTVRAWDSRGSFSSTAYITVGSGFGCAVPARNRNINLCFPTNNTTVGNPMQVVASVRDSHTYIGASVYVDGKLKHSTRGRQVSTSLSLPRGRHRVTVQARDNLGYFSKTVYVDVR